MMTNITKQCRFPYVKLRLEGGGHLPLWAEWGRGGTDWYPLLDNNNPPREYLLCVCSHVTQGPGIHACHQVILLNSSTLGAGGRLGHV